MIPMQAMPVRLVPATLTAACLAACSAPATGATPVTSVTADVAAVDWSRYVRSCAVADGGSGLGIRIDDVLRADVTGDGHPEALVVDECESSTSAWPQEVEVFDGAGDAAAPRRVGVLLADDAVHPQSVTLTVSGGRVTITGTGLSDDAPLCCPDLTIRRVYTWSGHGFALSESTQGLRHS
jgi:hypothetical protein